MDVVVVMVERRKMRERKKGRKDFCVRDIVKVYGFTWSTEFQRDKQINRWMLFDVFKVSELLFQSVLGQCVFGVTMRE